MGAVGIMRDEEKEWVLKAYFELGTEDLEEMCVWAEVVLQDMQGGWQWYLKALICTNQVPKAFRVAEELFRLDSKRLVHEVFLTAAEDFQMISEAVYLPWSSASRLEQALRRIEREDLLKYLQLAQQRYREMGEGEGLGEVVMRCVRRQGDTGVERGKSGGKQKQVHKPRLPIENLVPSYPRSKPSSQPPSFSTLSPHQLDFMSIQDSH